MGDYQRLRTDVETEIVPPIEPKVPPPCYHRLCFMFSLLFTFVVVFYFLWGLPCDLDSCSSKQHSVSWDTTLYGLELKGHMHLVGGHLVCILRAALWGKETNEFSNHSGGVIALSALTGKTMWYIPLSKTPTRIDCTILGNRRCLILGEKEYLIAIDYKSGLFSWQMKSQNSKIWPRPEDIDFPIAVAARGELITLSRFEPGNHRLLYISMETGHIISEPRIKDCFDVKNLSYSAEGILNFMCSNDKGDTWMISKKLADKKGKDSVGVEPIDYTKRVSSEVGGAGEHEITFRNRGSCPTNCQVSVNVTDSNNRTVWSYGAERTHVMSPLPLRFRPHITGFLIKLWQWQEQTMTSFDGVKVELIKERIVLITFNKTGSMHVVNASQTDITQFCYVESNECQPQLSNQTQSALLVDVNADGSQDLISYFVTYSSLNENYHKSVKLKDWELQSKVRVVRLEAELPKLYDAVSKH